MVGLFRGGVVEVFVYIGNTGEFPGLDLGTTKSV